MSQVELYTVVNFFQNLCCDCVIVLYEYEDFVHDNEMKIIFNLEEVQ